MGEEKSSSLFGKLLKLIPTPPEPVERNEEIVPNETIVFGRGVRYHQDVLKKLPKARRKFYLVGEPANQADPEAVMVCVDVRGELVKVAYLPAGEYKTKFFQELSLRLAGQGIYLTCNGTVESFKDEVGVQLELPKWQWLKERLRSPDVPS